MEKPHLPTWRSFEPPVKTWSHFWQRRILNEKEEPGSSRLTSSKPSLKFPIRFFMNSTWEEKSLSPWICFIPGKCVKFSLEIHFENLQLPLDRLDSCYQITHKSCSCPAVLSWGHLGVRLCQLRGHKIIFFLSSSKKRANCLALWFFCCSRNIFISFRTAQTPAGTLPLLNHLTLQCSRRSFEFANLSNKLGVRETSLL